MKVKLPSGQAVIFSLAALACLAILIFSSSVLTSFQARVLSVCLLTITLWATGIVPPHITSLLFFFICLFFSLADPDVVLAGFTSSAVWLIFGGLVLGAAITSTGLGKRIGAWGAGQLHGSYAKIIGGLVLAGVCFSFLMPSAMSRVVLLVPIGLAIADHFGFETGRNGRTGVILAIIIGSFLPAFAVLPANVPNMVLIGMSEKLFGLSLLYGPYFLLHFPVIGLLKAVIIVVIIVKLFPDAPVLKEAGHKSNTETLSRDEKILSLILVVLLLMWVTDFLHHISPAWVALGGAVALMFPGIGIIDKKMFNQKINWASIIFVAGILGLGTVINHSGAGKSLAGTIISFLPLRPGSDFLNFISIGLAGTITGLITTLPAMPAVFVQFSDVLSHVSGIPVDSVINLQVLGFSTVLLPYQAPPIVVGMQLAGEKFSHAAKVCILLAGITILFLYPIDFIWWKILGKI